VLFSDADFHAAIAQERLVFDPPLAPTAFQAASVDLTLHNVFWKQNVPTAPGLELTVDISARIYDYADAVTQNEIILEPGDFILGETAEGMSFADDLCGLIEGKSGKARHGLIVHCTAPHIAPGWGMGPPVTPGGSKVPKPHRITLEIANLGKARLKLRAGTAIAQLMIMPTGTPALGPYGGQHMKEGS
jgi:deoxycytidine triphosphate deaminase